MEELFGVSIKVYMVVLLAILVPALALILYRGWRNPVLVKLGLRNIPRRKAQTVLIIVGIMLSAVITAAAFGTGDTISYSIRQEAVKVLGPIDEIIVPARATESDTFGSNPYVPYQQFQELQKDLGGLPSIDGITPGIGETVPAVNLDTNLSEGAFRIAGVDPAHFGGFGGLVFSSGGGAQLESLAPDEGYINQEAAKEMKAEAGHRLSLTLPAEDRETRPTVITVKGVVEQGGLAGDSPTLLLPLTRVQELFHRDGQINYIAVSNRGDDKSGAELSEEVTNLLRVRFADPAVATELKELLTSPSAIAALEVSASASSSGTEELELARLVRALEEPGVGHQLVALLANQEAQAQVLKALVKADLGDASDGGNPLETRAGTLFADLAEYRVLDVKRQVLEEADLIGSFVTTFFLVMGLFSVIVGVLLIFLIFVMLAAARRTEMGMARAVGARRVHLVQMFVFEGTAYSLVSAAIGVGIGLGVSSLIVVIANRIFQAGGARAGDFQMTPHFEPESIVVAYCLAMVITLITVGLSAYRVSRLNISSAVRDLPTASISLSAGSWRQGFVPLVFQLRRAVYAPRSVLQAVAAVQPQRAADALARLVWSLVSIPFLAMAASARLLWPPLSQGWLTFLLGLLLTYSSIDSQIAWFRIGVALMIIGLGLMLRLGLRRTSLREDTADRIAYTFIGVVMLVFWMLPFDILRKVSGDLSGGPEMFFVSGISMVGAGVWTVMYNSDLLLKGLALATGGFGKFRPVMVTAVAYPMSSKFRTGLTLAMFALVIFTLIVMSILTDAFGRVGTDTEVVSGGWDIEASVNLNAPIDDLEQGIVEAPELRREDLEAIGGYTFVPVEVRQVGAEDRSWKPYVIKAADAGFLLKSTHRLRIIADGYGPDLSDVWRALNDDPTLVVVDAPAVPSRTGVGNTGWAPFNVEGVKYEDQSMTPFEIEAREPRTGGLVRLTVIGVLDVLAEDFGDRSFGMFSGRGYLDSAIPFPVPITHYRLQVAKGVDTAALSDSLEVAFRDNGLEAEVLADVVAERSAAQRAFNYLFTGFMALGLLVGIASLGVVSLRAVVERRQQIGVLRAIGYRRRMVLLSFLTESSFVALLGIAIGVALGSIISWNIVNDVREFEGVEGLTFSFPWVQIIIIVGVAYIFSLAATLLPARQASRIYPAEALRYE